MLWQKLHLPMEQQAPYPEPLTNFHNEPKAVMAYEARWSPCSFSNNNQFCSATFMINTDRLILRKHTLQDTDLVLQLATDPAVRQFIRGTPATREEAWHRLLRHAGHWSLLGFGMFAVFERATNQFIGEVGLADFQRGLGDNFDGTPEAAWVFTGSSHGKGFALEAMTATLGWFDEQGFSSRSVCIIDPRNTASIKLAGKLGFNYYDQGCYKDSDVNKYQRMRPGHERQTGK
jgi:RimJ/RimL family protein N-acetyltransferase